jgi:RNase P subunit RPR2
MLIDFSNDIATIHCEGCNGISDLDLSNKTCRFLEEFQEYENLPITCAICGRIEVFNMNLQIEENENDFEITEQIQRGLIKDLIKSIRADFVEEGA